MKKDNAMKMMKPLKLAALLLCVFLSCGLTENKKTTPKSGTVTVTTVTRSGVIKVPAASPDGGGSAMQPGDERAAQDTLPKSDSAMWGALNKATVKLNEKTGVFDVKYDDSVKALEGKPLTITGFMLPLEGEEKTKHFLLSKRTPTCPFCMPGGPTEVIEVFSDTPVTWVDDIVKIQGTLKLVPPNDNGMLYQLSNAGKL